MSVAGPMSLHVCPAAYCSIPAAVEKSTNSSLRYSIQSIRSSSSSNNRRRAVERKWDFAVIRSVERTDGSGLNHVADGESLDGLVLGGAARAVGAAHGLDVAAAVLVATAIGEKR